MLTMGQAVQVPLARQHACTDEVLPSFRPSPPDALSPPAALPPLAPTHSVPERVQSQHGPLDECSAESEPDRHSNEKKLAVMMALGEPTKWSISQAAHTPEP